jgi:D-galactonate transporter
MSELTARSGLQVADPADAAYRKIYRRVIPFLMLCYLFASLDRSNVAFAKLHFVEDLGFDDAIYGLGAGIFALGYILFEVPSNLLLQRIGIRRTLLRIMVAWGLCCALLAFIKLPWHFYTLRFLLGVAEAGFFPGVLFFLSRWAPAARRARLTALFMASIAVSGIVGGPLSGQIVASFDGMAGLAGWQWLFIVEGLPSCALGVMAFFYLQESPAEARWLTAEERAAVMKDIDSEQQSKPRPQNETSLLEIVRMPLFAPLAVMAFAIMTSTGGLFVWLPTMIRNVGILDLRTIGLISAVPFLLGAVAQFLIARHSDRTAERRGHAAWPALVGGLGWLLMPIVSFDPLWSLLAMCIATAGTFGAMGPFWALPPTLLSHRNVAVGIALLTSIGGLGNFISPPIIGWISVQTGSLASGQIYFGALLLIASISTLIAVRPRS